LITPGALSNAGWMHQKQPPAKTAVRVCGLGSARSEDATNKTKKEASRFIAN
jgi:hypothetical protein